MPVKPRQLIGCLWLLAMITIALMFARIALLKH